MWTDRSIQERKYMCFVQTANKEYTMPKKKQSKIIQYKWIIIAYKWKEKHEIQMEYNIEENKIIRYQC